MNAGIRAHCCSKVNKNVIRTELVARLQISKLNSGIFQIFQIKLGHFSKFPNQAPESFERIVADGEETTRDLPVGESGWTTSGPPCTTAARSRDEHAGRIGADRNRNLWSGTQEPMNHKAGRENFINGRAMLSDARAFSKHPPPFETTQCSSLDNTV